tara:strand:+ start:351 stop:497 length:147 start_codon:yes stop_codon:yes gene_type:complete
MATKEIQVILPSLVRGGYHEAVQEENQDKDTTMTEAYHKYLEKDIKIY